MCRTLTFSRTAVEFIPWISSFLACLVLAGRFLGRRPMVLRVSVSKFLTVDFEEHTQREKLHECPSDDGKPETHVEVARECLSYDEEPERTLGMDVLDAVGLNSVRSVRFVRLDVNTTRTIYQENKKQKRNNHGCNNSGDSSHTNIQQQHQRQQQQ